MKIGIYAGTFDPIHDGHIHFAINAVKNTELDKVVIVAEKNPYRKKPHASWDHRQAMIEHATENIVEAEHDYEFANKLAHSYTMQNMLQVAKSHYGAEHEFWFLVGSDIFEHIKRWQNIAKQHEYGGFVVSLRDDHTQQWLDERVQHLKDLNFVPHIVMVENQYPHISSRYIREQVAAHSPAENLSSEVQAYITTHHLYTTA